MARIGKARHGKAGKARQVRSVRAGRGEAWRGR
jgi:hypothetical protein